MNRNLSIRRRKQAARRGLAPLELVLSIPILLAVMALTVGIGAAASWKVRASVAARNAAWRERHHHHGWGEHWRPIEWPLPGGLHATSGGSVAVLDHQAYRQPVVRGPLMNASVNDELFDVTRGLLVGESHLKRKPPLMPKLGAYEFDLEHPLLDDTWRYRQMGVAHNRDRRIPILYQFPEADPALEQAFLAAVQAILTSPYREALKPLDRDEEIWNFYAHYVDFHPRAKKFRELSPKIVHVQIVEPLIDKIQGKKPSDKPRQGRKVDSVPARMGRFFLRMYEEQLALGAGAPDLQTRIDQLRRFLTSL